MASISGRVKNVVTGQYLNKVRITVKGTDIVVFTDAAGGYRIVNLPGGPITLEVFYTDLDVQEIQLNVPDGASLEQNVDLTSVVRYGKDPAVVKLNPFVVAADKETDAQAIAINEQRFAPNIKNVLSTDSLGGVMVSSVGEFLKFIPGVTAEYDNADILGISVRGIGGAMTSFSTDGAPMVTAWSSGTRSFQVKTLSLNDISRIEVTKVPTPSSPADSLAGSVNMVSKSAFERSRAELRYGVTLVGNSEDLTFNKTPHSNGDKNTRKIHPGFDFDYTLPIGKNFGIVVTGMQSNKYNEQHYARTAYNNGGTATGASISRPYFQTFLLLDGPRDQTNNTLNIKADWRVTPQSVLSAGALFNRATTIIGTLQWFPDAGTIGTPTVATGTPFSYGNDYTIGATGRGGVNVAATGQTFKGGAIATNLNYRFDNATWRVEAGISQSASDISRVNRAHGHFQQVNASLTVPVRITFSGINRTRPGNIQAFDASNREIDIYNIDSYRLGNASELPYTNEAGIRSQNLSVRRRLDLFPFPASLQIGGLHRLQTQDTRSETVGWTYNGPDGNPATLDDHGARFLQMQVYVNQDAHYGFKSIPWVSPSRAFAAFLANPALYSQSPAQIATQEDTRLTNSEYIEEEVWAPYLQAEASLFKNRLKVLTGVRFETTTDRGEGSLFDPNAVFVRNPDGTFARNAAGQQIRKPEAGAAGSVEQVRLTRKERAARSGRTYDGYYPSLHLTYDIKENFMARAAYAKTYGRPDFVDVIPRTTISEANLTEEQLADPSVIRGTLTVRNPSLKPWSADNYDLSFEYYTPQGGLFSAGVFLKEIKNFFGASVRLATAADLEAVGLDPRYVGWNLSTKFNAGDARITGAEFNIRQSLRTLGQWGGYFTVFANGTKLKLEGNQQASFTSFIPESGNWGFTFTRKQVTVTARWNYRGLDKRTAQPLFGPDGYQYYKARTSLDLSAAYQLTRRLALAATVNNVFNVPQVVLNYGSSTPDYARQFQTQEYGVAISVGLKGTF